MTDLIRPTTSQSPGKLQRSTGLLLLAIVGFAIAVRFHGLTERPLWADEAFSWLYARLSWSQVIELRRFGTNPPLYHLLLSIWVDLFGDSPAALRMPSVLLGVTSVVAFFGFARRLGGQSTGLWAAALMCVSELAIGFAQEARYYALMELLAILGSWALYEMLLHPTIRRAAIYVATMTCFVWVHTYAWFMLAAQCGWMLLVVLRQRRAVDTGRSVIWICAGSVLAIIALFGPWIPILVQQIVRAKEQYWIAKPGADALARSLRAFLAVRSEFRWLAAGASAAGVIFLTVLIRRPVRPINERSQRDLEQPPLCSVYLWLWAILPIGIPFVWSQLSTPIYQIKYAIVAQPAVLLLLAIFLDRSPRIGLGLLALLWAIMPPVATGGLLIREEWDRAAAVLSEHVADGEAVYLLEGNAYFALEYYLRGSIEVLPVRRDEAQDDGFDAYRANPVVRLSEMIERLDGRQNTSWVVMRLWGQKRQDMLKRLNEAAPISKHWQFSNLDVLRLEPSRRD